MIEESEKSPIIVLTVIIVTLLAYNVLTFRDKRSEKEIVSVGYNDMISIADSSRQAAEERASDRKFTNVLTDADNIIKNTTRRSSRN